MTTVREYPQGPPPDLATAIRARKSKQRGRELVFRCPYPERHNNGDAHPSARYHLDKQVWTCDACKKGGGWVDLCKALDVPLEPRPQQKPKQVAAPVYRSEKGDSLRRKVRWEPGFKGARKSFTWQKQANGGDWTNCKGDGNPGVLYGSEKLPEARKSGRQVLVVEGEKDCDTATGLGLLAVCNPEGAIQPKQRSKWKEKYTQQLAGLLIVVIADKDKPGRAHAEVVAQSLSKIAQSLTVVELPGEDCKDLTDWVEAKRRQGRPVEDIRSDLAQIVESAAPWQPNDEATHDSDDTEDDDSKETQKSKLIQLAASASLFHSPEREAFALIPADQHEETWPVRSRALRLWLAHLYYSDQGEPASSQTLNDALDLLEARALFDGPEIPVATRLGEAGGCIYFDLANNAWETLRIASNGWQKIRCDSVRFLRSASMKPAVYPTEGGSILDLKKYINVPDDRSFQLVVAWLLAALRPSGPFPVLVLQGEQGSAKSTTARILRSLIDPSRAPIRSMPRQERDLLISAKHSWILAFDNVSSIPAWLSDAFCRLSTGGGYATRKNYTDTDEIILEAQRPLLLNGIEDLTHRQDLLDRALVICLPSIPDSERRSEQELWRDFEAAKPRILGALLTAVSEGLRNLHHTRLEEMPRMADFAKWIVAAEPALPWPEGSFLEAYAESRLESISRALEDDPVSAAVLSLLGKRSEWSGTATDLLSVLWSFVPRSLAQSRSWPKSPRGISTKLRRAAPGLRAVGVKVEFDQEAGSRSRRLIYLSSEPAASQSASQSASQNSTEKARESGVCVGRVGCVANPATHDQDRISLDQTERSPTPSIPEKQYPGFCDATDATDAQSAQAPQDQQLTDASQNPHRQHVATQFATQASTDTPSVGREPL